MGETNPELVDDETVGPDTEVPPEPELEQPDVIQEPIEETGYGTDALPEEEAATPDPETEAPPSPAPTLAYDTSTLPSCLPVSSDTIAAGSELEYACTYTISLDGANVDPATIAVDWSVSASVGGDWSVQLLDPTGDPAAWTEPGLASAELGFQTAYSYDFSVGPVQALQDVATNQFGMRIFRPECSSDPVRVELDVAGVASMPGDGAAMVTTNTAQPLTATIDPVLAPLDMTLPTVSIVDVSVDPVAFSLTDSKTHGALTIRVDNPMLQCQPSNVSVSLLASAGSAIEHGALVSSVGSLDESSIAAAQPDGSGQGSNLDTFVVVSTVPDRAEAGSYLQTIDFELMVPGAIAVGTYRLDASAVVEPAA